MGMFDGQFGGFGGGFFGGPAGTKSGQQGMQFGGGFLMNPTGRAQVVQEVQVQSQGALTYHMSPSSVRPKDRSGRRSGGW